mmetsp:Transcript_7578/g.25514  ORF Transcript_7578/g.25514 Transcript_7578/m.25514 type:complete len:278 (-) Transcript_7578:3696-4529(-)
MRSRRMRPMRTPRAMRRRRQRRIVMTKMRAFDVVAANAPWRSTRKITSFWRITKSLGLSAKKRRSAFRLRQSVKERRRQNRAQRERLRIWNAVCLARMTTRRRRARKGRPPPRLFKRRRPLTLSMRWHIVMTMTPKTRWMTLSCAMKRMVPRSLRRSASVVSSLPFRACAETSSKTQRISLATPKSSTACSHVVTASVALRSRKVLRIWRRIVATAKMARWMILLKMMTQTQRITNGPARQPQSGVRQRWSKSPPESQSVARRRRRLGHPRRSNRPW